MYLKSAELYDDMFHFKNYATAADRLHEIIETSHPAAKTLLDVACSTGSHLEHLRRHYKVEGLDINAGLLACAKRRCPGVAFHEGDMAAFDLGKTFDVVTCLFGSIAYLRGLHGLNDAMASMARHLDRGGLLILEPWFSPDRYWPNRVVTNVVERPERKIVWMYSGSLTGREVTSEVHYLVGTAEGVDHFTELHEMVLFAHEEILGALENARLQLVSFDAKGLFDLGLYVARKL